MGTGRPIYLRDGVLPIFGFLHAPARGAPATTAVLMCPPFGWDEICSYRSRRDWACELAAAGFPTLRIDLSGSGDSGGSPREGEQLARWTEAALTAASDLRAETGLGRVAAIGIGLGGLVLCKAIAEGAEIDDLVLWGVPARGSAFVRELRAFSSLEDSALGAVTDTALAPPPLPDGDLWAGGFLLTAETVRDLEQFDASALELPAGRPERALMLDRDGLPVDRRLRAHLESHGVTVTVASGKGYSAMLAQPHQARSPRAVFARVQAWLGDQPTGGPTPAPGGTSDDPPTAHWAGQVELTVETVPIREVPLAIPHPRANLFAILSEPVEQSTPPLTAVLLNAGAIRRVGPNRMWVEVARRWAARGVPTVRLDLEGIGDAEGDPERLTELAELYTEDLIDQVRAALDLLQRRTDQPFVLIGLCSGAYWAFHAARDERVLGAFMLNPRALFWDESLEASRALRRGVMRTSSWRKLLNGQVPLEQVRDLVWRAPVALPRRALARRRARLRGANELDAALDEMRDTGKVLRFIFSGNEPLYEELEMDGYLARLDRWPNMTIEFIPGHIHTLRPLQSQEAAHDALDRALTDTLALIARRTAPEASPTSGS
jgi:alpha-beta hydrolase superfamily lysophospholipase